MIYLGIDYGEKKIGLAKANDEMKMATPLASIEVGDDVFDKLEEIVRDEDVDAVIIGVPVSFDGQEHEFAKKIRKFGEELGQKIGKKVYFQNEMLTSKQSQKQEVGDIDASAAALILQSFLDQKRT